MSKSSIINRSCTIRPDQAGLISSCDDLCESCPYKVKGKKQLKYLAGEIEVKKLGGHDYFKNYLKSRREEFINEIVKQQQFISRAPDSKEFGTFVGIQAIFLDLIKLINESNETDDIKDEKKEPTKKAKIKNLTLADIWKGDKKDYEIIIERLQTLGASIETPFVQEVDRKLYWTKKPKKGFVQYLKAFIIYCHENKFILMHEYSNTEWGEILKNTFNIKISTTPFKTMTEKPDEEYFEPFKNFPKKKVTK